MPEEVEVPAVVVDVPHGMGVGDVTGPLGMVLAVVLGLDKFGLLRRGDHKHDRDGLDQRDRLTRVEADVRHIHHRITEGRAESTEYRNRTTAAIESIRDAVRREIDRDR